MATSPKEPRASASASALNKSGTDSERIGRWVPVVRGSQSAVRQVPETTIAGTQARLSVPDFFTNPSASGSARLTILNAAYPFAPVSCDAVGGAEQILAHLDRAICEAGHHSIVLAAEGSSVKGTLIPYGKIPEAIDDGGRASVYRKYAATLARVLATESIDLIHFHGIDFDRYMPAQPVPVLVTLHLPPEWYPVNAFHWSQSKRFFNCVSYNQRRRCPADVNAPVIENGVRVPDGIPHPDRRWAVSLGRICPEKGFHLALDAAQLAGIELLLGGYVFPYLTHRKYFEEEIVPRLSRGRGRFFGPIKQSQKQYLLAGAKCLLVPSLVPETSSLVAMEALACGTPVIAFPAGALREIVEHGRTGFLVNSVEEMADAIGRIGEIDPEQCRKTARDRFSLPRMTAQYLNLYREIVSQ
jgi:glycosyltransferase involved in cell wall biosynthesis